METLVCLQQPHLHITKPSSPWKPRNPILHPTAMKKNPYLPTRTSKLHAEAKGFNGSKETVSRENYGSDDGDGDDDDKIPEVVMERMIVRILGYVGVPLITGIAFLQVFGLLKEQNLWDVPLWLPFLTTFMTFGASALGIAYGTLSTSWDPEKKGSLLGIEEAQKNWVEMWREEEEIRR